MPSDLLVLTIILQLRNRYTTYKLLNQQQKHNNQNTNLNCENNAKQTATHGDPKVITTSIYSLSQHPVCNVPTALTECDETISNWGGEKVETFCSKCVMRVVDLKMNKKSVSSPGTEYRVKYISVLGTNIMSTSRSWFDGTRITNKYAYNIAYL